MPRLWPAFVALALAAPASAQPVAAVVHPTLETAAPLARAAAAARDYRVYAIIGLGVFATPGMTCADPRTQQRLKRRGWNEVPDTPGSPHSDTPPGAAELFNRTLAADPGFQAATGCRPLTNCETRFGPVSLDSGAWRHPVSAYTLDRRCLSHPRQLLAAVRAGRPQDVERLLAHPPASWRRKDSRGWDIYDHALVEAAQHGRPKALARLLPKVSTGRVPVAAPERALETALIRALASVQPRDPETSLAMARMLRAQGARLTFRRDVNHSVLAEVLGNSSQRPDRFDIVNWLLAEGADPNGPPCGGLSARGVEPLHWALDDEQVFDRLVAAGARPEAATCRTEDGRGGATLTYRAIDRLKSLGPGFEERRRIAIKLLRMGGRARVWGTDPISASGANLEALSIMVAAAQLDGQRDRFLRNVIAGGLDRSDGRAAVRQAHIWLTCPHADPVLLTDRARLCAGEP